MRLFSILILVFSLNSIALYAGKDEFPEARQYTSKDKGFAQYASLSMKNTRKLVLTFDDGPHEVLTPQVLDTLLKYNVKATFFMLGSRINSKTIPIVERMLKEGHIIAAHSWDHSNSNSQTKKQFELSTKKTLFTLDAVMKMTNVYQNEVYFRFPYGAYGFKNDYHHLNEIREISTKIYNENCINFVFWGIDTADWVPNNDALGIIQNIKANMDGGIAYEHKALRDKNGKITYIRSPYLIKEPVNGGVVLMHDVHARTAEALPGILEYAKNNNVEIVPLNTIKEYDFGTKICGNQLTKKVTVQSK